MLRNENAKKEKLAQMGINYDYPGFKHFFVSQWNINCFDFKNILFNNTYFYYIFKVLYKLYKQLLKCKTI